MRGGGGKEGKRGQAFNEQCGEREGLGAVVLLRAEAKGWLGIDLV